MQKITKEEALKKLEKNNYIFAKILKKQNVSKINMICCGNSISSGFSMSHFTKPLLFRNENIQEILKQNSIDLRRYHFARAEDNNDEHIYSYLVNNTSLSEICRLNRFDLKAMHSTGVDESNIDSLYPLDDKTTINELISDTQSSNIIIYNGATGSFLDNVTRGGKHYLTYGIKRDCTSIEAFLKYIQEYNRCYGTEIQVYLCGVPSLLKASDIFMNTRLKDISTKYANVTYVENIPKKLLYKKETGGITPDTHYDEVEYLELNSKIIETISDNYSSNQVLIILDRILYILNKSYQEGFMTKNEIDKYTDELFLQYIPEFSKNLDELGEDASLYAKTFLKQIKKYLISRVPYDFYYIDKSKIKELTKTK